LAKKPSARPQSPGDLLAALRSIKVDSVAEDWTQHLDFAISAASPELSRSHLEATQQLGRVMQAESRIFGVRRRPWIGAAALILVAVLGGSAIGFLQPPKPLLKAEVGPSPTVKRWSSAEEQWFYARMLKTEMAYQAVWQYFPPNESAVNLRYSRLAKLDLAWLYREQQRFHDALQVYEELAKTPASDGPFALLGLAGQVVAQHQLGNTARRGELFFELKQKSPTEREAVLRDERFRSELLEIAKEYSAVGELTAGVNLPNLPPASTSGPPAANPPPT
jgi:hypothetical protein